MDLAIIAVGRLRAGPESQMCRRYLERAAKTGRAKGIRGFSVHELPESRARRPEERKAEEAGAIARLIADGHQTICLDEDGEQIDSEHFARMIDDCAARAVAGQTYVIGGPDGLDPALAARGDRCLSFGRLTWPHQLVRVMLAEQLYRAMTILTGHPYHRA
ncbi:MAG TPA: 23S rRNA (pseudouridine(1915)-N(3))-methyltransferase RlmH [Afifellaceae bacterium]|nr:23S rRNA (pseudouridine(1915)-N(3))-methyltransferase RlmH [Afifellaceae bacterium]